ncbi:hypothetical protein JCM14469_11560 [Desulfatiferula olefinivorans]
MKHALLALFFLLAATLAHADVLVIANPSVPDKALSSKDIKDIFLGKKLHWSDGTKIVFATLTEGDAHRDFLSAYLNKSPKQYAGTLEAKVFTTAGQSPKRFAASKKLVEYVSATKGAIGYIDAATNVKDTVPVTID